MADTPTNISKILDSAGDDSFMSTPRKRNGRPSLGPRDAFNIKMSLDDGKKIRQICDLQGISFQELLEPMVLKGLAGIDVGSLDTQGDLLDHKAS
ncbi:hypothetical protein [Arthrobacter rhombi]|nr:hypothetical protein [Micrococcaceae bacterium]